MPQQRASDMAQQGFTVTSAKAANGENVHINDHVYVSPPWSMRDGTPYIIARILEFLPPSSSHRKGLPSSRNPSNELHARMALYYRPSDISGRPVSDFRLLLGAIHTIVEPISVIRGRCYVRHKDKIEDLISWKHTPDHFYFVKFFDPYIKREYEVLRVANVNNIPPKVKEVLLQRYEYLLSEKEMVSDLLDTYRSCHVCEQWAASQDTVRCELCKNFYHMKCLTPPLAAKPAKGYSWACLSCTIQRRKDVESEKYRFTSNGGSAPPRPTGKSKKEKAAISDQPDVMFRGWPWRYFGLYTRAEDTLSEEDLIFPRSVTRVGTKFQANVMSWEEQVEAEKRRPLETEVGPSRLLLERGFDPGEKTHEATLSPWCQPSEDLDEYMDEVAKLKLPVPAWDVNRLNKAASAFTNMGRDKALMYMQSLKLEDYGDPLEWNDKELAIFEAELAKDGGLDSHRMSKAVGKRPAEVVRFTYKWKNKKLKIENDLIRAHRKVHAVHGRTNSKTLGPPTLGKIRSRAESEASDDEGSLYNASIAAVSRLQCAACSTRISNVWWKCPRTVTGTAMCESCGSNYRKYGVISFVKSDDAKLRVDKKDPRGVKRGRDTGSGTSTPVPGGPPKLPPCSCCKRMEPKASMARCKTCTFSVHSGCYGIAPGAMGPNWECELCTNVKEKEASLDPACVLCPRDTSALATRVKNKKATGDFDLLSAMKPTEGCQWAHILCSAWLPEVQYSNGTTFKTVEGISSISDDKWTTPCSLCLQTDGATIGCTDCDVAFHPSCAWLAGYRFGFEFALAKPGRRDAPTIARFKDAAGVMTAGVWCKAHDLDGRAVFDMYEMDPEQNENALQIYTASYKTIPPDESFALLRKATRLDRFAPAPEPVVVEHVCSVCSVDVSPRWHQDGTRTLCHQCWFTTDAVKPEPLAQTVKHEMIVVD